MSNQTLFLRILNTTVQWTVQLIVLPVFCLQWRIICLELLKVLDSGVLPHNISSDVRQLVLLFSTNGCDCGIIKIKKNFNCIMISNFQASLCFLIHYNCLRSIFQDIVSMDTVIMKIMVSIAYWENLFCQ